MWFKNLIRMSCVIVFLTAAVANAATITYDGENRPTLFQDVAVDFGGGITHYNVEASWGDVSFYDVYTEGDDAYYQANSSALGLIAWGSQADATTALNALIDALGTDYTGTSLNQYLAVPFTLSGVNQVQSAVVNLLGGIDSGTFLGTVTRNDEIGGWTQWTVVPVPAAVWLFGSGLLALVGIARRKQV